MLPRISLGAATEETSQADQNPIETEDNPQVSESEPSDPVEIEYSNNKIARYNLAFLSPEQISNRFYQLSGQRKGFTNQIGQFEDSIKQGKAFELGGVNFLNASERKTLPTVQALLTVKRLAWQYAVELVENSDEQNEYALFNKASFRDDLPLEALDSSTIVTEDLRAADQRWHAQLNQIYEILYFRQPSTDEIKWSTDLFVIAMNEQTRFTPAAWVALVYSLLAAEEFWLL